MSPTDVAIVGLACRFPGAAGVGDFWRLVRDGLEVAQLPGDVADFDAAFFNLSPREARAMDPRQRLALELAWELFEDAFLVPETLRAENVSIYLGALTDDYAALTLRDAPDTLDHHSFSGISRGMIANRVSYAFGLHGPSMTVDSGQSSSLVAVHLACQSLRAGESALAIAGGIHLNLADETAMLETAFGAVSPSGHTYAFDERADGYVRREGGALALLKPLRAALEDGNRIHGIIRGSAVGNAGHSSAAQSVPSVSGQADVIRRALASAGLDSNDIDYIEAHGTGTVVGDPIEARALAEVFAGRQHRPVSVGSVKTNIGHTGAAAGIAGLLKAVLAIENAVIPPTLNHVSANPEIDAIGLGLQFNTVLAPWPAQGRPRRAGVSSFGMGGTNAHVIIEQPPARPESVVTERPRAAPLAWVVSGRSEQALAGQAARLLAHVTSDEGLDAADVAWSLATTRSVFEHRAVLVGGDREALTAGLGGLAAGEPGALFGRAHPMGKTVFVFPGRGSQWPGMGAELYERFPVFAQAFDEAARAFEGQLRSPLREVMWGGDAESVQGNEFAEPALFAVEIALATLLQHWGVVPDVVMGHSVGEIAAAYVAGVLSLTDAARVVVARGRLMAGLPAEFGLLVAGVSAADPRIDLVSNVTGGLAGTGYGSADYWEEQVRAPARLVDGVRVAESLGAGVFVEVGPGGVLTGSVQGSLAAAGAMSTATLAKDGSEVDTLLNAAGRLFVNGMVVQWAAVFAGLGAERVELPTYAFQRRRFWLDTGGDAPPRIRTRAAGFVERLTELAPNEERRELVELVCAHAAAVLGHSDGRDIDAQSAFQDLGFESLTGVELGNRLKIETGLALSRTVVFDYPTPAALADHLQRLLHGDDEESDDEKIWSALRKIRLHDLRRTGLLDKLLLLAGEPEKALPEPTVSDETIDSLDPDALIAMALNPEVEDDDR